MRGIDVDSSFEYAFPAIRGLQAGHAYYVSMFPLRLVSRLFLFDEEGVSPELRAQRTLNVTRIPEIAGYILSNRDSYVFSALTASVDRTIKFEPTGDEGPARNIGRLRIPMDARFILNDGQHRRAAIDAALQADPSLGDETIAVVLFLDPDLKRCQQMFTDLNRYAVRPARSLSLLYDHRDQKVMIAKEITKRTRIFKGTVEYERSTLAERSGKLFTFSAIQTASAILLADQAEREIEEQVQLGVAFWDAVAATIPEWTMVREKRLSAGEFRRDYVSAHGLALSALAHAGRALIASDPESWRERLGALRGLDWSRNNAEQWEGRAMIRGRLSKAHINVLSTADVVRARLGLAPTPVLPTTAVSQIPPTP